MFTCCSLWPGKLLVQPGADPSCHLGNRLKCSSRVCLFKKTLLRVWASWWVQISRNFLRWCRPLNEATPGRPQTYHLDGERWCEWEYEALIGRHFFFWLYLILLWLSEDVWVGDATQGNLSWVIREISACLRQVIKMLPACCCVTASEVYVHYFELIHYHLWPDFIWVHSDKVIQNVMGAEFSVTPVSTCCT